jgi:hypothetical protein
MYCPECRNRLSAETDRCGSCGIKRLAPAQEYPDTWPNAPHWSTPSEPVLTAELLAYADESGESLGDGSSRDYYLAKWAPVLRGMGKHAGWNWAAFFCGMNWCFWRRLYLLGIALLCTEAIASILLSAGAMIVVGLRDHRHPAVAVMPWVSLLVVRSCLALAANRIYLRRTLRHVQRLRVAPVDFESRILKVRKLGGTSGLGLATALLLSLLGVLWNAFVTLGGA